MKKKISFPQLVVGMILGLIVVLGAIAGVSFLYFSNLSAKPAKPDYPEISKAKKDDPKSLASVSNEAAGNTDSTYVALVAFSDGLIMRKEPNQDSEAILTLEFEETVRVMGVSPDEQWEEVILETTGDRGWVARGNTKRVN